MIEKISNALEKAKSKVSAFIICAVGSYQLSMSEVMAAGSTGTQADGIVTGVLEVVVNIFSLIGGFFVLAGIFKLIMAYRNNQPEDQASAAKDIVIGAIFVVFRIFAWEPIKGLL